MESNSTTQPNPPITEVRRRQSVEEGRALVAAWQASGLSQRDFAAKHGVRQQRLSYWRRRLEGRAPAAARAKCAKGGAFVQVPPQSRPVGGITIELPDGCRVHVGGEVDAGRLRAVLTALRGGDGARC